MTVIPRITDGKQSLCKIFFLVRGGGGGKRGVVKKVHHHVCGKGDKAAPVCTIRESTTLKHSVGIRSSFKISTQRRLQSVRNRPPI